MIDLTNLEEIKRLDPKNVYGSTGMLPDQCRYIWDLAKSFQGDAKHKSAKNIILCGMGGSQYGSYIVQNLFHDELKVPLVSYGDYHLPGYISKDSLVILSSYSGDTEEPINCAQEAVDKGFSIVGLTAGGKAYEMSQTHNFPVILFDQKYNPSGQPRLGTGYMVVGIIALLTRLGYLSVSDEEIQEAIDELRTATDNIKDKARLYAQKIFEYIPVISAAEFLNGNVHIIRNQINETAKSFSAYSELPELNHHLLEGFKNPLDKKLKVLFINSALYSEKLSKRLALTKDISSKSGVDWVEFKPQGRNKVSQVLEVLSFGAYLSFYLGILYGENPGIIPWVDYFKEQLGK